MGENAQEIIIDTDIKEEVQEIEIQKTETADIEIDEAEIIDIEIEEALPYLISNGVANAIEGKDILIDGGTSADPNTETVSLTEVLEGITNLNHAVLNGREFNNQHPVSAITGLGERLDKIEEVKRVYSSQSGLSEFRRWADGNPKGEDRSGYFVKIERDSEDISICTEDDDVYGITVQQSGFVGGQDQYDKSDNPTYAMVGIAGALRVRTDGKTIHSGEYVVPNKLGEATFSETNCGYKVISQGSYSEYPYVVIAVTPQNDKLSKMYGTLMGTDDGVGKLLIELGNLEEKVTGTENKLYEFIGSTDELQDIINENKNNIQTATNIATEAKEAANAATNALNDKLSDIDEAVKAAQDAAADALGATESLANAKDLIAQMEPILEFESGVGGFVNAVTDNGAVMSQLMHKTGANTGDELAAILMSADDDGLSIQHLVSHVNRYSVGQHSLSYGLNYKNAKSILTEEYYFVPTVDTTETMEPDVITTFEQYCVYIWNPNTATWAKTDEPKLSMENKYQAGENEGDLWYCWQAGVEQRDEAGELVTTYLAGTLYRWSGKSWIAVASTAENAQGRMLSSIQQTADEINVSVSNMGNKVSQLEVDINGISSTVYAEDENGNTVSRIEQTADAINQTIADTKAELDGTISNLSNNLSQRISDNESAIGLINVGEFHAVAQSFVGTAEPPIDGKRYTQPPRWNRDQGKFVFNETFLDEEGTYYFLADDHTRYCHVVDDGYDILVLGDEVVSMINSTISDEAARIDALVEYKEGKLSESLANISQKAEDNEASITQVAALYYHPMLGVSEEAPEMYGDHKYTTAPEWNIATGQYEFDINKRDPNGVYYMADENNQTYCKVVTADDGTKLYETYGLGGSSLAALAQQVDENSAHIGMVVDKDGVKGEVLVEAINGQSTATISANRIKLTATDEITSAVSQARTYAEEVASAVKSDAISEAETLASTAENNAKEYTDNQLTDYSTTAEMNSAITQKANSITSEVSAKYATKDSLGGYVTTEKLAQIEQKVDDNSTSIGLVVKDGAVDGSILIEAINNDESNVKISADHVEIDAESIDLTGYVTIKDLSESNPTTTIINGDNITTGTISAGRIDLTNYYTKDEVGDEIVGSIEAFADGLRMSVGSGGGSSYSIASVNDASQGFRYNQSDNSYSANIIDYHAICVVTVTTASDNATLSFKYTKANNCGIIVGSLNQQLAANGNADVEGVTYYDTTNKFVLTKQDITIAIPTAGTYSIYIKAICQEKSQGGSTVSISDFVLTAPSSGATIVMTNENIEMEAQYITLTGLVTFEDLAGEGSTQINGANIITGTLDTSYINATTGKIGGFTINDSQLSAEDDSFNTVVVATDHIMCAGQNGLCIMTSLGNFQATNATISGNITATAGQIGDCAISDGVLQVGSLYYNGYSYINATTSTSAFYSAALLTIGNTTNFDFSTVDIKGSSVNIDAPYNDYINTNYPYMAFVLNSVCIGNGAIRTQHTSGSSVANLGFFDTQPVSRPEITGTRTLDKLYDALIELGLILYSGI